MEWEKEKKREGKWEEKNKEIFLIGSDRVLNWKERAGRGRKKRWKEKENEGKEKRKIISYNFLTL